MESLQKMNLRVMAMGLVCLVLYPSVLFARHDMVGRWQLEKDCDLHISVITIMTENDQAVLFCSGDDHGNRMSALVQEKGQDTEIYRERDNAVRWYRIKSNRWIEVYDGDTLLCTGHPMVTSGGMPLPTQADEEEGEHGH